LEGLPPWQTARQEFASGVPNLRPATMVVKLGDFPRKWLKLRRERGCYQPFWRAELSI
jgi:hypothetical protein